MADQYDGPVMRAYEPTLAEQMKQFLYGDSRPSPERRQVAEGIVNLIPGLSLQQAKRDVDAGQYRAAIGNTIAGAGPFVPSAVRMARNVSRPTAAATEKMLALPPPRSGPSSPVGRGTTGEPIPMGKGKLHVENLIESGANATKQARQDAAVQKAIDEAVRRSRTASPAQMSPAEIDAMRRRFMEANPQYIPANARNMGVQEIRAAQDAFAGPSSQALVRPIDISQTLGEARVSPVQYAPAPAPRPASVAAPAPAPAPAPQVAPARPRDVLQVASPVEAAAPKGRDIMNVASRDAQAAQQAALDRAAAATAEAPQPWGAARPGSGASGLPPGSTVVPPRAPMSDPLKTKFPLSTELQLLAAPPAFLAAGEVLNQTGRGETMYPELFGPGKRAQQAAIDAANAAAERQRIDDLDVANAAAQRGAPQQPFTTTDFFAPTPAPEPFTTTEFFAPSPIQGAGASDQRYSGTETAAMPQAPTVQIAKQRMAAAQKLGEKAPAPMRRPEEPGILSRIFSGGSPLTTKQLFQQSVDNPDDAGAWMRAERQYARTHRDQEGGPNFDVTKLNEQGMARGGAANSAPTKEALLHKSLEIIHHMIRNR